MKPSGTGWDGEPVVLISGSAGTLGRNLVEAFHAGGWCVGAAWHEAPPAFKGEKCLSCRMDCMSSQSVRDAVRAVLDRWSRLDVVIHAAGFSEVGRVTSCSVPDWDHVFAVQLDGARRLAESAWPHWEALGSGHLIAIGSHAARGTSGQIAYGASKAALAGWIQSVAREGGRGNIRANLVLPGWLDSKLTASLNETQRIAAAESNVLGRWNDPAEVARFVVQLASMRNVSGQVFALDSRIQPWLR